MSEQEIRAMSDKELAKALLEPSSIEVEVKVQTGSPTKVTINGEWAEFVAEAARRIEEHTEELQAIEEHMPKERQFEMMSPDAQEAETLLYGLEFQDDATRSKHLDRIQHFIRAHGKENHHAS